MKEIILHIGPHKTGTTAIQAALKNYSDNSTRCASFSETNHSVPIYTMFSKNRYRYHIWSNKGKTKEEVDEIRANYKEVFESDIRDDDYDRLIISGEDISILEAEEKRNLIAAIESAGNSVKIVFFARDPRSLSVSLNQQNVKGGAKRLSLIHPAYKRRVGEFLEMVPKDNIIVVDFDEAINNGGLINYFSRILNIKLPVVEPLNEAISLQALALIYKFNNIPIATQGTAELFAARQTLIEKTRNNFSVKTGSDKLDTRYFGHLIHPDTKDECEWLKEEFGISYDFSDDSESCFDHDSYLNKILDGLKAKEVNDFFEQLGSCYDSNESLELNFIRAFSNLHASKLSSKFLNRHVNNLFNIAVKIENGTKLTLDDALVLMKLAQMARPDGPLINAKLKEWSS